MKNHIRPFHVAFPTTNLNETKEWYTNILRCTIGRTSDKWIDFNLYGHQIVAHLVEEISQEINPNKVDDKSIPPRHFGVILTPSQWEKMSDHLNSHNIDFIIKPYIRFSDQAGEQYTLFIKDTSGNYLEFKAFDNDDDIFKSDK